MTSKLLPNGLSRRTNRCLLTAGIPIDKQIIIKALKSGKLHPNRWPPTYGRFTHYEVCHWAGIDPAKLPYILSDLKTDHYLDNGLSFRANKCLSRSGIPITKKAVLNALRTKMLSPGKHPGTYGKQTHAELCRWVGVNKSTFRPLIARP